jgi:rubrerythrin
MRLGTGTGERLAASFVLSAIFVFGLLGIGFAAKLPVEYPLVGGGLIFLFFFGVSALLILWSSDGQLADEKAIAEDELEFAQERAAAKELRMLEQEDRWDVEDGERAHRRRLSDEVAKERHARRLRDNREDGYRCPFCRTREYPLIHSKISAAGWVFFWLTCLFLCWPICWIGLLITETYRVCPRCGARS